MNRPQFAGRGMGVATLSERTGRQARVEGVDRCRKEKSRQYCDWHHATAKAVRSRIAMVGPLASL